MPEQNILAEAYEYLLLENDQRAAWLLKTFGKKLSLRVVQDFSNNLLPLPVRTAFGFDGMAHIPEFQNEAEQDEWMSKLAEAAISWVMGYDPTPNKIYARWIVSRLLDKNHPEKFEDVNDILKEILELYQQAARARRINGNIDEFKSFNALYTAVEPFRLGHRETSGKKDKKNKRDTKVDVKVAKLWENDPMLAQAHVIHDSDAYMVLVPETQEASNYFGKNTNWCTTSGDYYFDHYTEKGPLYVILRREDATKWQFHFPTGQFCDVRDRPINLDKWIDENNEAFMAIGPEKFFPYTLRPDYTQDKIGLRHFTKEMMEEFPSETLAHAVENRKDLKALPEKVQNDPDMLAELAKRYFGESRPLPITSYEDHPKRLEVIAFLLRKWDKNPIVDELLPEYPVLLRLVPEKSRTDDRKKLTACNGHIDDRLKEFIPEPWPDAVSQVHYNRVVERPADIPEKFRTENNMARSFAEYPENMQDAPNWVTLKMMHLALDVCAHHFTAARAFINNLPEEFRSDPDFVKRLMVEVREQKGEWRDEYISIISTLPEENWPKNAPRLREQIIFLAPNFYDLPNHLQTVENMTGWLGHGHAGQLPKVPAKFLAKEGVEAAVLPLLKGYKKCPYWLKDCDPKIVKPEWVRPMLEALPEDELVKMWESVPLQYMTGAMKALFISKGVVPFNNAVFTKATLTPKAIAQRFAKVMEKSVHDVVTHGTSTDYRGHTTTYEKSRTKAINVEGFKELFDELPDWADRNMAIKAASSIRPMAITAVPKTELTADVLTYWLGYWAKDYHRAPYVHDQFIKQAFACFPKTSYTTENAPLMVKLGLLNALPQHLRSDSSTVEAIAQGYGKAKKALDWKAVTAQNVIDATKIDVDAVGYNLADSKRKDLVANPDVAMAFIDSFYGQEGYRRFSVEDFRKLYAEPKMRAQWTEEHYKKAAGELIHLSEIPKSQQTDAVKARALTTRPQDIAHVEDAHAFMNQHGVEHSDPEQRLRALAHGVYMTEGGWAKASDLKHHQVKGVKGYYTVADVKPRGQALFVFDDEGKNIDTLMSGCEAKDHWGRKLLASELDDSQTWQQREQSMKPLLPYRLLVEDALQRFPDLATKFGGYTDDAMAKLNLYPEGKRYVAIEHMARETVMGRTANPAVPPLTYVETGKYRKGSYWFFEGDSKTILGRLISKEDGRGVAVENFFSQSIKGLLDHADDLAHFLAQQNVASGQSAAFKATDLYTKLGLRGPGRGEWYCLLEEVIVEDGPLRLWRSQMEKGIRYCVTDEELGTLIEAKRLKDGDFTWSAIQHGKVDKSNYEAITALLAKGAANIDKMPKAA
jgi:hypothetical protein